MLLLPTEGELIGVKGRVARAHLPEMKRAALLFDRIAIAATIGWSADGFGVDADISETENSRNLFRLQPMLDDEVVDGARVRRLIREPDAEADVARSLAAGIRERYRCSAVALLNDPEIHSGDLRLESTIRVILGQLPLPSPETSWDAIWAWREDDAARRMYARLRVWMNRATRNHESTRETLDELAAQLADYQTYMSLHHRNMRHSRIEVVLTTTAEVLESIVTFQWSTAVRRLLDLRRAEMSLLAAELDAPGREIAYIDAVQQKF